MNKRSSLEENRSSFLVSCVRDVRLTSGPFCAHYWPSSLPGENDGCIVEIHWPTSVVLGADHPSGCWASWEDSCTSNHHRTEQHRMELWPYRSPRSPEWSSRKWDQERCIECLTSSVLSVIDRSMHDEQKRHKKPNEVYNKDLWLAEVDEEQRRAVVFIVRPQIVLCWSSILFNADVAIRGIQKDRFDR